MERMEHSRTGDEVEEKSSVPRHVDEVIVSLRTKPCRRMPGREPAFGGWDVTVALRSGTFLYRSYLHGEFSSEG